MKNENKKFENKKYVKTYFKDELNKEADAMTYDEMINQLKELEDTRYWVAITRYVQARLITAQASLCALDPVKDPTSLARAQGIISGLLDLQNMLENMKETIKQAEKKANAKNDSSPDQPESEVGEDTPIYG